MAPSQRAGEGHFILDPLLNVLHASGKKNMILEHTYIYQHYENMLLYSYTNMVFVKYYNTNAL